ncbi:MAG: HAD-IIB family hydrolase [bacterium]|nr:HAD-IIB family hydrolase [bacterium]
MTENSKQLIIFDKDGTLTPSKGPMDQEMADLFMKLLEKKKVAVISGSGFPLFENQVLKMLPFGSKNLSNLYILPASGTKLFTWKGTWQAEYSEQLSEIEKKKVISSLQAALKQADFVQPQKMYGQLIEDRDSQITFSALGQEAPLAPKEAWDPKQEIRKKIITFLQPRIPEFDVRIGGTTSIDITKKGVNKAYGIRKLEAFLKLQAESILFVGDALYYGGNDYPAKATGVDCIQVSGPEETKKLISSFIL